MSNIKQPQKVSSAAQRVEKETLLLNLHKSHKKQVMFKTFHRNVLKGEFAENC